MANVYWFGNGGNWSDHTNHWSNNSGNSPASLHGAAPETDDNVFFDSLSFNAASQVVTVDAAANCLNMDWTGSTNTPTLAFSTNTLNVYGNVTLIAAMTSTMVNGYLQFYGAGVTFKSNGHSLGVRFQPTAGSSVTLDGDLTATRRQSC